ncbi:MAG: hypothetical protein NC080_04975 [Paraprevotella sp.]|nr:hypothetical protein [Paraprevotella sp.]
MASSSPASATRDKQSTEDAFRSCPIRLFHIAPIRYDESGLPGHTTDAAL